MNLIISLVVAFPLGYFLTTRVAAYLAYVAIYFLGYVSASVLLLVEWAGGSTTAFGGFPDANSQQLSEYIGVNVADFVLGALLVQAGAVIRRRRAVRVTGDA